MFHFRKVEKMLGNEHPSALTSVNNPAEVFSRQGRYDEAEQIYLQALALKKRLFRTDKWK